jgi:hypothetical protein
MVGHAARARGHDGGRGTDPSFQMEHGGVRIV